MLRSVLGCYDCFVFDVDRTVADNGKPINDTMIGQLAELAKHGNIALVTARSMPEGMDEFAGKIAKLCKNADSCKNIYIFPTHAVKGYQVDLANGKCRELYNYGNDPDYLQFRSLYRELLHSINLVENSDVHYDESAKLAEVQIHDRLEQVTLFFSNIIYRNQYLENLKNLNVTATPHGRNVIHITPAGINKNSAIEFLSSAGNKQFLIFADGFYHDERTGRQGNDLVFADLAPDIATCINVGADLPK